MCVTHSGGLAFLLSRPFVSLLPVPVPLVDLGPIEAEALGQSVHSGRRPDRALLVRVLENSLSGLAKSRTTLPTWIPRTALILWISRVHHGDHIRNPLYQDLLLRLLGGCLEQILEGVRDLPSLGSTV